LSDGEHPELVIVVDEAGQAVGVATRADVRINNLCHRAVAVVILRADGALLVHRRADDKVLWPALWDVAAGGAVDQGETYEDAAARELAEELGIDGIGLVAVGGGRFRDGAVNEHLRIYSGRWDGEVRADPAEVAETAWVAPEGLAGWLGDHAVVPDSMALIVPRLAALAKPLASGTS
jgi:isopentenyldiphosphate isomerase